MTIKDKLYRYEALKNQSRELEKEMRILGVDITEHMLAENAEETPVLEVGKIQLQFKKKYTYSPAVEGMEQAIASEKERERISGEAECELTPFITYRRVK